LSIEIFIQFYFYDLAIVAFVIVAALISHKGFDALNSGVVNI